MAVVGGANLNALQQPPKPSKNPTSLILTRAGYRKVPARLFSESAAIGKRKRRYLGSHKACPLLFCRIAIYKVAGIHQSSHCY